MKVRLHEVAVIEAEEAARRAETPEIKELRRLLAEADEDFEKGNFIRFRNEGELRAHAEEVKARGRARLDAEQITRV